MIRTAGFDKVQLLAILFSTGVLWIIFKLVEKKRVKEEYSILWFFLGLAFLYLSIDRMAVDRLGDLVGIAYKPSVLMLIVIAFMTLVLMHITIVITRLSEQNRELVQEAGLAGEEAKKTVREDVLVIIPAFNEAASIGKVIGELRETGLPMDILVVNDGSRDETGALALATGQALVVNLPANLGIGGAVQTGFKYACRYGYRTAIQFDGDGQHVAMEIPKLLKALTADGVDVVIGSRFLDHRTGYRSTFVRRIGIRLFRFVNSLIIGQRVTDNTSGHRAYNRKAIEFLAADYPVDYPEPEAVILLGRNGYRIGEVSVLMRERQGGDSSIAGVRGVYYMIKVLLGILMTSLRKPVRL